MKSILFCWAFFLSALAFAKDPTDSLQLLQEQFRKIDSLDKTLHYKTGKVSLAGNSVVIDIPSNYKFLDSAEARYILEEVWGNLKGQTALGMLVPANSMAPIADYAFVVEYDEMGFVKDDDAANINYNDLLDQMKKEQVASNKEREAQGVATMSLVGWASAPFYDKNRNVLHWAKEFSVTGAEVNTLNYDVRVLGRRGVLILQAVSSIAQLDSVKKDISPLLGAVTFTNGNRYSDFNEETDNVAAWTIGGLVAGKVLAKAGLFAFIGKFLKIIVIGLISVAGAVFKFFKRKKSADPVQEYVKQEEVSELQD